jgi:flavin-dependent dehydrogenase
MYDAIVVGARCAGSPTAMLLARRGYRVLLVDRATFPSDTISTHYLQPDAVALLDRWGLLERVRATGAPDVPTVRFRLNGVELPPPPAASTMPAICPRRTVLDKLLVDAAAEAGVEVREGFSVRELRRDGDRVIGISGQGKDGLPVDEDARIVIGADGRESFVARSVGAERYKEREGQTCGYYAYFSGVETLDGAAELCIENKRAIFLFPTNDNQVCLAAEFQQSEFAAVRADPEKHILAAFDAVEDLGRRVRAGRRETRWFGMLVGNSFYRKPYGPGWALVGDAGYLKDPVTGRGIDDAFRDAELLTEAIDTGFTGKGDLETALADYEQKRNEASAMIYDVTHHLAGLDPSPDFVAMMRGTAPPPAAAAAAQ